MKDNITITTPKEKAKELVDRYFSTIEHPDMDESLNDVAKKCALIAVNEIINILDNLLNNSGRTGETGFIIKDEIEYWQQVKEEINNS